MATNVSENIRRIGHIWSISLYAVDVKREELDTSKPYVWALFELAIYDYEQKSNDVIYTSVEFSNEYLTEAQWPFPSLSKAQVYECAQAIERVFIAIKTPSSSMNLGAILAPSVAHQRLLKVFTGRLLYSVRTKLALPGYYEPSEFFISRKKGILTSATRLQALAICEPTRPSFVGLNASVFFDSESIANAVNDKYDGDPRSLGLERLKAIARGKLNPVKKEIEWLWPETTSRENAQKFVLTPEVVIQGPSWSSGHSYRVASVMAQNFETVMVSEESFSFAALFLAHLELYREFYLKPEATGRNLLRIPIFIAHFPMLSESVETKHSNLWAARQKHVKSNYFYMPGFPCFDCILISASSESRNVAEDACKSARVLENLWPAYGIRAVHMLDRRTPPSDGTLCPFPSQDMLRSIDRFPAGTIYNTIGTPMIFTNCRMARFDFSAFYPCLYAAGSGWENCGLRKLIYSRLQRDSWTSRLKPALVAMFGGLKYVDANGYQFVIGAANIIAKNIEKTANALGFGIAVYVKDGFWGAFDPSSKTTVEQLREACEKTANETLRCLTTTEQQIRDNSSKWIDLRLRTEGEYTDGLFLGTNKYWLYNSKTEDFFVCGVAGGVGEVGLSNETRNTLTNILKKITVSAKSIEDIQLITRTKLDEWIYVAFEHRGKIDFWSEQTPGNSDFLVPEEIRSRVVGKLEMADACLGGETKFLFIPKAHQDTRCARNHGVSAAFPISLVDEVFCLKIHYEAHLKFRLEGILDWVKNYAWLRFRNDQPMPLEADEASSYDYIAGQICYSYEDVGFLFT
ncbi:DNA helicase/primase complex-associated protein [Cacatuid alphaherpesvirus 2]|uniref:DNA helicase/primase complex-associated protein n=1 Tax=Cacatuid alphaherpesvirus 2 TaxID=2604840 RepID=A0A5B9RBQ6_9ALPH|nr:DNA helicase/primase complex-associated protein [Cacatuid alphaherpesvirus 2]QEG54047.1 DNA helicase/primase complex-associated protein [Cacatuid alphaherpesvirus 2]